MTRRIRVRATSTFVETQAPFGLHPFTLALYACCGRGREAIIRAGESPAKTTLAEDPSSPRVIHV
jgi:hypothetical protein